MYSWEMDDLIKRKNYNLSVEDYLLISNIKESPQISIIERKSDKEFFLGTNDGYMWIFKVGGE